MRGTRRSVVILGMAAVTVVALYAVTFRLQLDPNVGSLLPDGGDVVALKRYVRAFGGGDLATVMVRGADGRVNAELCARIARALSTQPSVEQAADRVELPPVLDPMLVWRYADAPARARLAQALTPAGMRARLAETRGMLLLPGSGDLKEMLARDPLRLAQIVFAGTDLGAGVRAKPDGGLATADGTMCLVLVKPRGQALRAADARAFADDVEAVLAPLRRDYPAVELGVTGGHAIAAATEAMLKRDLLGSGPLALFLTSVVFVLVFRRARALGAVVPPLVLGTLWTAGLAAVLPGGLSAIAVAFTSVVVGVGVDTGVHVYAALLEARRRGLAPREAAAAARRHTAAPVLLAALTAAAAFSALAVSDIRAVRQLGILCAAGEVLTALAIVAVTPEIGRWLERRPPPPPLAARWTRAFTWLAATRRRALVSGGAIVLLPIAALVALGPPRLADAVVAIRPRALEPLRVQEQVLDAFGGKHGRLVVLVADPDPERARARGDHLVEALATAPDVASIDALTAIAPAATTQRARLAARDALDLPAKAVELERALRDTGFATARFAPALAAMRAPPSDAVEPEAADTGGPSSALLVSRYLGRDAGDTLVSIYLRPSEAGGALGRVEDAVRAADPEAVVTGYNRLEASLKASLRHDLPRIALVAGLLVVLALAAALRRARDVILAALVVVGELAGVLVLFHVCAIPLHVYSALVIPVLLGITVDEGMFLLHRAREGGAEADIASVLRDEGPPIAATALTTAAGFSALAFCEFDGLRDLGLVGAIGSTVGLLVALVLVPAGLRVWSAPSAPSLDSPQPQ